MGQETKTPKKRKIAKIPLHVYLGYLLILTMVFTVASFAKFATAGDAGDAAKVASFSVSASVGDNSSKSINFNDASTSFGTSAAVIYDINVTNKENKTVSEVAVGYRIVVKLDESVINPGALSLSLDGTALSPVKNGSNYVYTYVNASPMPANVETNITHQLTVTAISAKITDDYQDIPLSVSVTFEQIN